MPDRRDTASSDAGPATGGLRISREALGLAGPMTAPTSETERNLARIWAEALSLDQVGVDDDFFDLGGDSLIAETIALAARAAMRREIQLDDFASHRTIAAMARFLDGSNAPCDWSPPAHITVHRAGGAGAPVFYVPGGLGQFFPRSSFTDALSPARPQFVVQTIGLRGEPVGPATLSEIADAYIRAIVETIGDRPFHLAGVCAGADTALEMARRAKGMLSLTLFDPRAPYRMRRHRSPMWLADFRRWAQTEIRRLRRSATGARHVGNGPADRAYVAEAARIVDAARRRYTPRRWSGAATLMVSEQYAAEGAAAWRSLVDALDVQTLVLTHRELFNAEAAATGDAFERRLSAAETSLGQKTRAASGN